MRNVKVRIPTEREVFGELHRLFREKFGRDPEPGEPLFFDPDQKEPAQWPEAKVTAGMREAMRKAGTPPQIIFAFREMAWISSRVPSVK
jgi:hypothetical protein